MPLPFMKIGHVLGRHQRSDLLVREDGYGLGEAACHHLDTRHGARDRVPLIGTSVMAPIETPRRVRETEFRPICPI